jgi:hypothetical protein
VPQVFSKLFLPQNSAAVSILVFLPQDFAASAVFYLCLPQEISR